MDRAEALAMIEYFWTSKHDPTRWTDWEEQKANFPRIVKAWEEYQEAERRMYLEVRDAVQGEGNG